MSNSTHHDSSMENTIEMFSLVADALTTPSTLEDALQRITQITSQLMAAEQACFLFRDETRASLIVRNVVGIESPNIRIGHSLNLPDQLLRILWNISNIHQINCLDSGIQDIQFPILVAPVSVKGARVGLIIAGGVTKDKNIDTSTSGIRRKMLSIVCQFASLIIENSKMYDYLKQHFAAASKELQEQNRQDAVSRDETEQLMVTTLREPAKVIRLLTESFFKEMVNAGFNAGHIALAAARLLELTAASDIDEHGNIIRKNDTTAIKKG